MGKRYSNSYIQEYSNCPLAARYKYELKLRKVEDDGGEHHLVFGRAMHEAFSTLYKTGDVKASQEVLRANYPVQLDPEDFAKTADTGCFTIEKYWDHYHMDTDWEIIAIEGMDHTEDDFTVKPDLVVKERSTGNILIVDHKFTKKYLNYDYFSQFDPNMQVTHYYRYCAEKYGACDGFLVNAISLLHLKRKSQLRAAGFNVEFERQVFYRNSSQIAQTVASTNAWIADIERSRDSGLWRAVEQPMACKWCSYQSICKSGWNWDDDAELILSGYKQCCDKWSEKFNGHCQLELGHEGDHSSAIVSGGGVEFEVE